MREQKTVSFEVKQVNEETGIFEGYAATFSDKPDSYGDIIDSGAFKKSLKEGGKRVKILWQHSVMEPIGKPDTMTEDEKGLLVKGKLSLGVQRAREVLSLMKDGVITELSIGYDTVKEAYKDGVRHLKEVKLWDISPVTFAANTEALINSVKSATSFSDLPLADRMTTWDATASEKAVRNWAGGDSPDWTKYRKAFFWVDSADPELFGSYKLGFADIVGGKLTAIPKGVFAVAAVLQGARGGVNIPDSDMAGVKSHVEKYYAKMKTEFEDENIIVPWNKSGKSGRVLSAASMDKVRAAIEALQALVESADKEPEPGKSTPLLITDEEVAELESKLDSIGAELNHSEVEAAEARIDRILDKINMEVK